MGHADSYGYAIHRDISPRAVVRACFHACCGRHRDFRNCIYLLHFLAFIENIAQRRGFVFHLGTAALQTSTSLANNIHFSDRQNADSPMESHNLRWSCGSRYLADFQYQHRRSPYCSMDDRRAGAFRAVFRAEWRYSFGLHLGYSCQ